MSISPTTLDTLLNDLNERAKELSCLYRVEKIFNQTDLSWADLCRAVLTELPSGLQYPTKCQARIQVGDEIYETAGFRATPWVLAAPIAVHGESVGHLCVSYTEESPLADVGVFLKDEQALVTSIAERFARHLLIQKLTRMFEEREAIRAGREQWWAILDLLRRTNPRLLMRVARKMLNHLCTNGVAEAVSLLESFGSAYRGDASGQFTMANAPTHYEASRDFLSASEDIFRIAADHLTSQELTNNIQKWITEDRSDFLANILENPSSSLEDIIGAIERYHHLTPEDLKLSPPREMAFRVALVRRFLTDQPYFINIAKHYIGLEDYYDIVHRIIFPPGSHGKLGGKSFGMLLAECVLQQAAKAAPTLQGVRTPRTWYLTSDGIIEFLHYNNFEDIVEQKYKDIDQVRQDYPYVVQLFKASPLPPVIFKALVPVLDDFGDKPLIVRSSSLLEDRLGTAFAGKYKSVFLANQGSREERLGALADAIAEVYASTFGPDPIEYRWRYELADMHEEMGIMIQEVVGTRVGRYYLPAFAGVALSHNDFRWSARIKREDGLLRLVPGLGTRAVDRMGNDYPILLAPGKPSLRVNVSIDEQVRYSPKRVDVINLGSNRFESIDIPDLIREYGYEYPLLNQVISYYKHDRLQIPSRLGFDAESDHPVVTFEGLLTRTPFIERVRKMLDVLQETLGTPVDIEFAHDGRDFYLLQCRPQSYGQESAPAVIPHDVPPEHVLFRSRRYVANGTVGGISHIVYVDPHRYGELAERSEMLAVGRAVSRLNQVLPKRQFILMGPGRWGSRGDIQLGVSVTYSDIDNAIMLIEIARSTQGLGARDYAPELSFGTHFFQDLVEASIRYLPLYPDENGSEFNEALLRNAENALAELAPEFAHLSHVVRAIDVARSMGGRTLQVLMNADEGEAVAIFTPAPGANDVAIRRQALARQTTAATQREPERGADVYWRWRNNAAEELAMQLDAQRFGVKAVYLFGSTKNAAAGPASDIDLLVHFEGDETQRRDLLAWLEGWSLCLAHVNYLRTGHRSDGLLDAHLVSDEDIERRYGFAAKITDISDPARLLPMGVGGDR